MKLLDKIKKEFFNFTNEGKKIQKPSYSELLKYENFQKTKNNKLALSFGAGRSGQNWFTKIFNSHPNWIGTCERFSDYEAFYRYVTYYDLPIDKYGFFKLVELASKRDMSKYENTMISSPYFSFGVEDLSKFLDVDYLFLIIRNPINTIESFHAKGWYSNQFDLQMKSPLIDISTNQYRSFSRIVPKGPFFEKWLSLTRIGKLSWFWSSINKSILDAFNKINNIEKILVKLEDVNQNYEYYEKLSERFNFQNKMKRNKFNNLINKVDNKGPSKKYEYSKWSKLEKKEFEENIRIIFPHYDNIKTNI